MEANYTSARSDESVFREEAVHMIEWDQQNDSKFLV
jgi:hypothetical protein